jgi:hypothetical protein
MVASLFYKTLRQLASIGNTLPAHQHSSTYNSTIKDAWHTNICCRLLCFLHYHTQSGGCLVLLSIASLATVFVAADTSALLLSRISNLTTCNPLWLSNATAAQLPSTDLALLLLGAISVLLHGTYAAMFRVHNKLFGTGRLPSADADAADTDVNSSTLHPLLMIGLQLSCLAIGVLLGLASCAV